MTLDLRAIVLALLADDEVRAALRAAMGASTGEEWLPLSRAAETIGVRPRTIVDAARRGEIAVHGPKGSRVVRRRDLDRWLASHAITVARREERVEHEQDPGVARAIAKMKRRRAA